MSRAPLTTKSRMAASPADAPRAWIATTTRQCSAKVVWFAPGMLVVTVRLRRSAAQTESITCTRSPSCKVDIP